MLEQVVVTAILTGPAGPAKGLLKPFGHAVCALSVKLRWTLNFCKGLLCQILKVKLVTLRLLDLALERVQTVCEFLDVASLLSVPCDVNLNRSNTNPLLGPRFIGCLLN